MKTKKNIQKCQKYFQKTPWFIIDKGRRQTQYFLIKDFNKFMYDNILHCGRKKFYFYCLQAFSTGEIFKSHVVDCFKINGKQSIKMHKKGEYVVSC